jgi:hypothetical protein
MVKGLDLFKKHFANFQEKYVLIGGTACMLVMEEAGIPFRATKDLDIVLSVEVLNQEFVSAFKKFVDQGNYQNRQQSTAAVGLTIVISLFPFLISLYVPAEKVALYLGILVSIYAVCKFFMAPIMGALSDHFGRKPILFFSLLTTAAGYFTLGIGGALSVLFLGRVIAGISAGDISALYAYVADSTQGKERTKGIRIFRSRQWYRFHDWTHNWRGVRH